MVMSLGGLFMGAVVDSAVLGVKSGCPSCSGQCSYTQPWIISCQKVPWSHHLHGMELGLSATLIPELVLMSDRRRLFRLPSNILLLWDPPRQVPCISFTLTLRSILNNKGFQSVTETWNVFLKNQSYLQIYTECLFCTVVHSAAVSD